MHFTCHYGVDKYRDSGIAFAEPAINSIWLRRWCPPIPESHEPFVKGEKNKGDFKDAFWNKMKVMAIANPYRTGLEPAKI